MENQEKFEQTLSRTLQKLVAARKDPDRRRLRYQFDVFQSLVIDLTGKDRLMFNTLFARIAYLGLQHKLPGKFIYELHLYRKEYHHNRIFKKQKDVYQLGLYLIARLLREGYGISTGWVDESELSCPAYRQDEPALTAFLPSMRGIITEYHEKEKWFSCISEQFDGEPRKVDTSRMELFQENLSLLTKWLGSDNQPVTVELLEVGIDEQQLLFPKWIIIEPDYLIDVTAIAECFQGNGARPEYHLLSKYLIKDSSTHLLIGQIVNFVMDRLIQDVSERFEDILGSVFKLAPLALSALEEKEVVGLVRTVKEHYTHLQRVISQDFPSLRLDPKNCIVEPSFYSPALGLQGRLDVFHGNLGQQLSVIELKSGNPFRPNLYGLSANHYTQTLLYDLMVRNVYKLRSKPLNYILYSRLKEQNLRYAPTVPFAQMEAMGIRNGIYAIEREMMDPDRGKFLLEKLRPDQFPGAQGFLRKDMEKFHECYSGLDDFEKAWFNEMNAFIAREHHLAKIGIHGHRENNGLAAVWLEEIGQKLDRFSLYHHLEIVLNHSMLDPPEIRLRKTDHSNELAGFRKGDIVLLRPMEEVEHKTIRNQVIRATLTSLEGTEMTVRLRSRQYNQTFFKKHNLWCLEPDFLDSGFRKMYQELFRFSIAPKEKRSLLLGRKAPGEPNTSDSWVPVAALTVQQNLVLKSLMAAPDYFLLWGPPGTGKTHVMLGAAISRLIRGSEEQIMVLAYTNRAVDEICRMLESMDETRELYLRIGSSVAASGEFRHRLFDQALEEAGNRKVLRERINQTRIFVGTTSSVSGKPELFLLKKFDVLFVDEASQILEPMIIGLLSIFKKFVLIGDHRQLPAVITQPEEKIVISRTILNEEGFSHSGMALFERLFRQCSEKGWTHAIGQLTEQGRMHRDILVFPNRVFYGNQLVSLDRLDRLSAGLPYHKSKNFDEQALASARLLFVPCSGDPGFEHAKNNVVEAEMVAQIIHILLTLFQKSSLKWDTGSIGIITPFRAQIAQIRNSIRKLGQNPDDFTIDTVERYQGGARDIIIYSAVVNSRQRLDQIQSLDAFGTDRKLNVAVTRAKEQFILVGNETILGANGLYRQLINDSRKINFTFSSPETA